MSAFEQINVMGRDWLLIQEFLEEQKAIAVQVLCAAGTDIDETNRLRGRIMFIDMMLKKAESVRKQAASGR
jgi:hypothetical protein